MGSKKTVVVLCLFLCCLGAVGSELRTNTVPGAVFTFTEENDLFIKTDRHYTQGLKFSYLFEDDFVPHWLANASDKLPAFGLHTDHHKMGFAIGQNIFTPADLKTSAPILDDRPYAGWLYGSMIFQRRGTFIGTVPTLDNYELSLGVVGPASFAEDAQKKVHQIRGLDIPQGWDNQLRTEPGLMVRYTRLWLFRAGEEFSADAIPDVGFALGNIGTFANAGVTFRLGYHVPTDFGPAIIDAPAADSGVDRKKWGAYVFTGVDGKAVGYNEFLDGTLFRSSQSVDRNILVGEARAGAVFVLKTCEISYTYVVRSHEFHQQKQNDIFGSLSLKFRF
ncbi:MAG: hypothetical protein JWN25_705 [Verrucomicrobiales bacterium]|nr:hypothetical protein [Verrucomicrobiales bacterium]